MKKILWNGKAEVVRGDGVSGPVYHLPTANFAFDHRLPMKDGVYAGRVTVRDTVFEAVIVYGVGEPPKFEAHLFGFEGDLLGQTLEISIEKKISELIPWVSVERMRQKILHDLTLAQEYFAKI